MQIDVGCVLEPLTRGDCDGEWAHERAQLVVLSSSDNIQ